MLSSRGRLLLVLFVVGFAAGAAFHRYVWGPKYELVRVNGAVLRMDTYGGETFVLNPDSGWTRIPGPPPPYRAPSATH